VEEPGRSGPEADELEVDVGVVLPHVREDAVELVAPVETGVGFEGDADSSRNEGFERVFRRSRMALPVVDLRRVELDEPHAAPVGEDDRVAVHDLANGCLALAVRPTARKREG
jgi:hypothetical protein